jgi:hypothetical protein
MGLAHLIAIKELKAHILSEFMGLASLIAIKELKVQ